MFSAAETAPISRMIEAVLDYLLTQTPKSPFLALIMKSSPTKRNLEEATGVAAAEARPRSEAGVSEEYGLRPRRSTGVTEDGTVAAGSSPRRSQRRSGGAAAAGSSPNRSPAKSGGVAGRSPGGARASRRNGSPATTREEPTPKRQKAAANASVSPDYEDVFKSGGLMGVFKALEQTYGSEFSDVNQAFIAAKKSFSKANYDEVMRYFSMDVDAEDPLRNWKDLEVAEACLPESVLRDISLHIYRSYATHGSPAELKNEAATAAFLLGPFQCLTCLFGGILRDKPEQFIPGTTLSGGGRVEVEIFCRETVCTLLRELKFDVHKDFAHNVGQACCELFATWQLNQRNNKDAAVKEPALFIPVYVTLSDTNSSYCLSYDGKEFRRKALPAIPPTTSAQDYVWASLQVAQYLFAVLLDGYNKTLKLYQARSEHRGRNGDSSARGSHLPVTQIPVPPLMTASVERTSSTGWADAAKLGWQSAQHFKRAHESKSEIAAQQGLDLLYQSISAWPPASSSFKSFLPNAIEISINNIMAKYRNTRLYDPNPDWTPPEETENAIGFPLENKAQDAVESFWSKLAQPGLRTKWEAIRTERRSPFNILSDFSATIEKDSMKNTVKRIMQEDEMDTLLMIEALAQSHRDNHWAL